MTSLEAFTTVLLLLVGLAVVLGLFAALAASRSGEAAAALAGGRLTEALALGRDASARKERLAAAIAARLMLDLDAARELLEDLLAEDSSDGEAWLERGITAAWAGRVEVADEAFNTAARLRSDLTETILLHRAWLALSQGDHGLARRLFEEIEAPLETKLRTDLGPGDPSFAEWFLIAGSLYWTTGRPEDARWAAQRGAEAAPGDQMAALLLAPAPELLHGLPHQGSTPQGERS